MKIKILLLATLTIESLALATTPGSENPAAPPAFSYQIDAAVTLLQKLGKPGTTSDQSGALLDTTLQGPRTLGLSHMGLGFSTTHEKFGGLSVGLRPDERNYQKDGDVYRDFDPRSGSPYRKAPTIKLLDTYELHIDPIEQMTLRFGVFDHLAFANQSYPNFFGFTGRVELPKKFSGLSIEWGNTRGVPTIAQPEPTHTLVAGVMIFQGNEDRAETYGTTSDSFDTAAEAQDSYLDGAAHIVWTPAERMRFVTLIGGGSTKIPAGKSTEVFAQLLSDVAFDVGKTVVTLSLDLRRDQESFDFADLHPPDLVQQSGELFSTIRFKPETWLLLGARYGTSERHNSTSQAKLLFNFLQGELGFLHQIHRDLSVATLLSNESHNGQNDQGDAAGALQMNGKEEKSLKRFLFTLQYQLGRPL